MSRGCVSINCYIRNRHCDVGLLVKCGISTLIVAFRQILRRYCARTIEMKILLVAVTLLVAIEIEAHPGWGYPSYPNYPSYPSFQDGTRNNPGRGPPWAPPRRMENLNNGVSSEVEWICQNPKTNDIMIIASDDTRHTPQHQPGRGPWWQWQNVPPGHQKEHHQQGNHWTQPIIIVQEISDTDKNQTPPSFTTTSETPNNNNNNNNNNNKPTQQPPYHGGEGSIDIRLGAE